MKHGGTRLGAGRHYKWVGGKTKTMRVPAAYVAKIVRVINYMDSHEGQLPVGIAFFIEEDFSLPGYDASQELPYPRNYSDTK